MVTGWGICGKSLDTSMGWLATPTAQDPYKILLMSYLA
jgi:hypothetical protein